MIYKKMFFPVGGGNELEERLYGAFLIAKYFNTNLDVLHSYFKSLKGFADAVVLPNDVKKSIAEVLSNKCKIENDKFLDLVQKVKNDLEIEEDKNLKIDIKIKEGIRSSMVELYSKISDIVIAAAPPSGIATETFEAAVMKSGKPVLMFPRIMRKFSLDSIVIGWNNSPECSRAFTSSIELLKMAKKVEIITAKEYFKYDSLGEDMLEYLRMHGVEAKFKVVKTKKTPGKALLNYANDGNFDLIVAGAYGHKGLKELMLGGTTRYLFENSKIPIFLSH